MQLAINRVADWADSHGFLFSVEKSQTIVFRRTRWSLPVPSLLFYGRPLRVVHEARFLGLFFDERLSWVTHLKALPLPRLYVTDPLKTRLRSPPLRKRFPTSTQHVRPDSEPYTPLFMGAFRFSPIPSLQVDAHVLLLDLHRKSLATRAFLCPIV